MTNKAANTPTSTPTNSTLVLTHVDNGQCATSDSQSAIAKDIFWVVVTHESQCSREIYIDSSDSNPDQSKFFLGTISAKDPRYKTYLSNEQPTLYINSFNPNRKTKPWTTNLDTNGFMVDFLIDSSAEINLLPKPYATNFIGVQN